MELKDCCIGKIVRDTSNDLVCFIEGLIYNSMGELIMLVRYPSIPDEVDTNINPHFNHNMEFHNNRSYGVHPANLKEID